MKSTHPSFSLLPLYIFLFLFCGTGLLMALPAEAMNQTAASITQRDALTIKKEGDRLLKTGHVDDAIKTYRKALAIDSSLVNAWFNLAIAYYNQRDLENTAKALDTLVRLNPLDAEAQYNLGCLYLYQGDVSRARQSFLKAMHSERCRQAPSELSPLIAKAMAFFRFFHGCSAEQRYHLLRLMQDGLEPVASSSNVVVF